MNALRRVILAAALIMLAGFAPAQNSVPLTAIDYKVVGTSLKVTPAVLSVPKGIAGSISAQLSGGVTPPAGSFLEATLRGPSFPARRLVGDANKPLLLPPLNLVGDFQLDGIRLVDGASGATLFEGTPSSVPVRIFDEVLVSRVTSRPLTLDEIRDKGIVIDEQNFRAVEFEVGFVLDGKTIPVKFPVVAPTAVNNTEVIPAAELEERLRQAEAINDELSQGVVFPPELESAKVDVQVKGINFQVVDEGDGSDLALKIPPIPALMVIPGSIGFLNQFFSVMIFTENGAPAGSGLSVHGVTGELVLPLGPDRVAGTFAQPGDDPLRFARVGTGAVIQPVQPIRQPGADGKPGTADDVDRLQPGETGQGEFLVEGLQEGLHVMDLKLHATLEGLAAGSVEIEGRAAGSVLVRNPKFSLAFAHPRTVRSGEPYEAFVTILNTSLVPANLVNVTLNSLSISGGVLANDSPETVELGTILPGQTATAKYRIIAQRTGAITFSNLTTSDESLVGRFRLHAGVDERGVALSPDTLVLPSFVDELPADLLAAANRVLGQALSVAKAGQTPAGVLRVSTAFLKQKAVELAEAGQRVRYGEALARVLPDLLLDWQGARDFSEGWDQILRETNAGLEWRQALARAIENASAGFATSHLLDAAHEFAGRGETWFLGAVSVGDFQAEPPSANELNLVKSPTERATLDKSTLVKALGYPGRAGAWLASADAGKFEWKFATAETAQFQVNVVLVRANGTATELLWRPANIPAGACLSYDAVNGGTTLDIDDNCDGTIDRTLAAQRTDFVEQPPTVLFVRQDPEVLVGRPSKPCFNPETTNQAGDPVAVQNYANVLAVLFSKPMTQAQANVPAAYALDSGNEAAFVQVQPGGRVALVTMREPVGRLIPRMMTVAPSVTDARGNALASAPVEVKSRLVEGVVVRGRVIRADGSFSAGVPVTLTYYDEVESGLAGCLPFIVRSAQIFTDAQGEFQFDFVLAGIPYSVSATDTSGLSAEVIAALLESTHADALDRDRLLALASSPSVQNTLLAEFAVGALPQAIAKAEGLDRALVRDNVESGSPREGTTAIYALRFRGRGTVSGTVFASDGVTPVANAAVNLFPDPGSRELGRGVFSDNAGRFAFFGVPLGTFSVEATSSTGLTRVVSDVLTIAGEAKDIAVVLSASVSVLTELQGRVTEPDGAAHAGAQVFVGRFDPVTGKFGGVVATATSDSEGYWRATGVPVNTYDLVALSADGKRKGERRNVVAVAGAVNTVNLTLQARATVTGRVETITGFPVANALVGGGEALVHTDASGLFTLTGVPTGQRTIAAALERDELAGIEFPRTGSASVNVVPGADNFVIVPLNPAGRIFGRVLDADGHPVPNADVAIPQTGGFLWVYADAQGNFEFVGLPLGKYDVSSPAPPHEDPFNGEAAAASLRNASTEEILATIGEAFAAFTGVNNPLLNGEGANFNPLDWGFTKDVTIIADGRSVPADVKFLGHSTIGGTVINGQGVPIGARVRLTGIGPSLTGAPTTVIRGERDSDPALGTFSFDGQALIGDWGLQAASPFFPVVISAAGRTTNIAPDDTDNVLQFPAVSETNGSLSGIVLQPDGVTPAGANIKVQISFGPDFIIRTDANGHFATQAGTFTLPAINSEGRPGVGYTVTATDETNSATGRATVTVLPAQDNQVTVRLLGLGTAIVNVVRADGSPAEGATVEIRGGAFPNDHFEVTTDAAGQTPFFILFEGPYGACASLGTGLARTAGRVNLNVAPGSMATATLVLAGTGNVSGRFFARDGVTPIAFANVALGALAFSSTDADGRFDFPDVPLGTYRVLATDAVTGRTGSGNVTLAFNGESRVVNIVETALGEVFGRVVNALGNGNVPNAQVTLHHSDSFVPARTVTTGPDGAFRFPGTPAGALSIEARDPLTGGRGTASATLPENSATFEVNVALAPVANLTVTVFEPDGTPATLATVRIPFGNATVAVDTNAQGMARFENLPLSAAPNRIIAESRAVGLTRRWAGAFKLLASQGAEETQALTLRGVGTVTGTVFQADGTTPAASVQVTLTIGDEEITVPGGKLPKPSSGEVENVIASAQGVFTFTNIPAGDVRLTATAQSLGASENAVLVSDGQTVTRNLTLSASGTVIGRIVRANGVTPAAGTDIVITFMSQSGLPGRVNARTVADGLFSLAPIPVGAFHAEITNADFGGIARRDASVSANNETVNLGDISLDEAFPAVVQVTPPDTATDVSTGTTVELLFSEALAPASVEASGVFIRRTDNGALVAATLTLVAPAGETALRLVRLVPVAPLVSEKTYQTVVVDGDLVNATGNVTNRGPRDLVGRPLAGLFTAMFTTRDDTPPTILSFTPENGAELVDVSTPVRLSFDETIQSGAAITLTGPAGAVAGTTTLGVNGLVLVFTPNTNLAANATFTASVSGIRDIAGNFAVGQPLAHTFATLDTLSPAIADIVLKDNAPPIASAAVVLQAIVPQPEPGMKVRFTADFALIGDTATNSLELPFTLPASGAVTIRATTIDRFGNVGPVAEKTITVTPNSPPTLTFTRLIPPTGPVPTGGAFSVRVSAMDDSGLIELRAAVTAAAVVPVQVTSGADITLSGTVRTNAGPAEQIVVLAQAKDTSGASTGEQQFLIPISDATPPSVLFSGPPPVGFFVPGTDVPVSVRGRDAFGVTRYTVTASGAFTGTFDTDVVPASADDTRTLNIPVPAGLPANGASFGLVIRARDAAGNVSLPIVANLRVSDLLSPQVLSVIPPDAATNVSTRPAVAVTFNEPLAPASINATTLRIERVSDNVVAPAALTLSADALTATATPNAPLDALTDYRVVAATGITDVSGNALAAQFTSAFTTSDFRFTSPVAGSQAVEGQSVQLTIAPANFAAARVRFFVNNIALPDDTSAPFATPATAPLLADVPGGALAIRADALDAANVVIATAQLSIIVRGANEDSDGDTLLNGAEIAAGSDPFRADAGEDPDNDGLTNAQEIARGTKANDSDTDDDLLNDGAEVAANTNPLNPDTDGDGLMDGVEAQFGTNPTLADTDGDTLNDGFEVGIGRLSVVSGSFTFAQAKADAESRGGHLLTITSALEEIGFESVLPNAPATSAWIGLTDQFIEGAFRWVTGEPAPLLRFGPGEPNNAGDEDGVHLRSDGLWNDNNLAASLPYVLELGFFTNPALADTDGDTIPDNLDTFPGQQNRAPAAANDPLSANPGVATVVASSTLLSNDSDADGDPFVISAVGTPANGTALLESAGAQVRYIPNAGFTGPDSFTYTITDPGGLTASATVNVTVSTNHPPVAGTLLTYENRGLQFDGSDDFANGPTLPAITDNFTFELWVRPNRARGGSSETNSGASAQGVGEFAVFPTHGTNSLGGDPNAGAGLSVGTNGFTVVEHAANYFPSPLVFNTTLSDWTHVAVVYENKQPRLYVNGVLVRTGLVSPRVVHPGTELSTTLGHYQGQMDEYRVWNFARTGADIAADFGRRLSGNEPGLAVYWRMDEPGGAALLSEDPAARDGSLGGGTARITPGAPIVTFGQDISVIVDTTTPIVLAGSDEDGDTPAGRVKTLPQHGKLFQRAAAGGVGVEITSVPTTVTDATRRIFYQPDAGYLGEDTFIFSVDDGVVESASALALVHVIADFPAVTDDLWDVSQGTIVIGTSGFRADSPPTNVFGASSGVEPGNGIFADGHPAGFAHFVEWRTPGFVLVTGARLSAIDEPGNGQRGFTEMRLFGRLDSASAFTLLATFRPGENPYFPTRFLKTAVNFAPFVGQEFRAEFDQFGNFGFPGPRIQELDAIGETVVFVPQPQNITLQNPTSDLSQGGFSPAEAIDGIIEGGGTQNGWAGDIGGTVSQTAVFETVSNVTATADTEFEFQLIQPFGSGHFIGRFRLSATTDARSEFADGLFNGGDVSANWTVLDVMSITSTGGETFTVLGDESVLVSGTLPNATIYTARVKGIAGNVTGFRLEVLEDPSLPTNGPGRASNGNWVLNEFTAAVVDVLVPNRAPQVLSDSAQATQGIPVTTGNVLANDSDPEGDAITIFDFTQPAAGTGSVVSHGDGTFTYTPPNGAFTGTATFTYRATDSHQPSQSAIVTINVVPSLQRVWINAAGGIWSNPANWLNGALPGPDDIADITLAGTYTVTLDVDPAVSQLVMGNVSGLQTLNVNGRAMTIRDAANTSGGAVVLIPSGTLTLSGPASFVNLTQSGGALRGLGTVTVTGALNWTGGAMLDAGKTLIAATATGTISGGGNKDLALNRVLENAGMLIVSGGTVFFNQNNNGGGAVINNLAGATLEAQGEVDFSHNFNTNSAINNAGIFRKTGGGETFLSSSTVALNNTGTVEIVDGSLRLDGGGTNSGMYTSTANGRLEHRGGTFLHAAGATVNLQSGLTSSGGTTTFTDPATALGTLTITGGDMTFTQTLSSGADLIITNGTVRFNANQSFATLTQSEGILRGLGTVTVTGTFSWTDGAMLDAGKTLIAATATGTISGGGDKDLALNRVLENAGTLIVSGGTVFFNQNSNGGGAVINNLAGATLEAQGEVDFRHNFASNSAINNAGIFRKTGGGETFLSSATVALNNTGTVEIVQGTLRLDGGGTSSGTFTSTVNGTLDHSGGTFFHAAGATVNLLGALTSSGGTTTFADPAMALGTLTITGGDMTFAQALTNGADIFISNGTVRFNANQSFVTLTQSNGVLRGIGTVTVTGTFSWTDGAMLDGGKTLIAATATGTISGGGDKDLAANRVLENAGTLIVSGGTVFFNQNNDGGGAVINNLAGAIFEVQGEVDFRHNFGSTSAINNAGLFRKTGGGETFLSSAIVAFNNTGTVEMVQGTLRLDGGGSLGGMFDVQVAGALNLSGGSFVIPAGSTLAGSGAFLLTGGNATFAETLAFSSAVTISSGTWTFNADQSFTSLSITEGILRGTGTVTVTGTFSWTDGAMLDAGKTLIAASATGTISGGGDKDLALNRVLENAGTLIVSGGTVFFNQNNNGGGAVINNLAGATLEAQGEVDFRHNFTSANSAINNAGIFRKTGGGETFLSSSAVALNNTGSVEVVQGTLRFDGGGSLGGTFDVQAAGTLDLSGGTFTLPVGTTVNVAGALALTGGTGTIESALSVTTGSVTLSGGSWNFAVDQSFPIFTETGGTLRGTATVTVTGTFSWTDGAMFDAGKTLIAASATGTISGGGDKDLSANRVLENAGTLIVSGGTVFFNQNNNGGGAVINNLAGATLEAQGEVDFRHNFTSANSAINNTGTFRKTGGGETLLSSSTVALNNTGIVEISEGSLRLEGGFSQTGAAVEMRLLGGELSAPGTLTFGAGRIVGAGTITANVTNAAVIAPSGAPVGTITILGNYTQTAAGRAEFTLAGDPASGLFDQLAISGTATFDGTLRVSSAQARTAEVFPLVTFASRSGIFATVEDANGGTAIANYLAARVDVTLTTPGGPAQAPAGLFTRIARPGGVDTDGDGESDRAERAAGTDPNDALSRPRIRTVTLRGDNVILRFATSRGRGYLIEACDDLAFGKWRVLGESFVGSGKDMIGLDAGGAKSSQRFYRLRVGAATSPVSGFLRVPLARQTPLGIPFQAPPVAAGRLTSADGALLRDAAADWSAQQWTRRPFVARVTSGGVERQFAIAANSAESLTLSSTPFVAPQPGDYYEIAPSHTLGALVGTRADSAQLVVDGRWQTFRRSGALWFDANGSVANRLPLDPTSGVVISRRSSAAAEIVLTGEVPSRPQQSSLLAPGILLDANRFPIAIPLSRLQFTPAWRASERADATDMLRAWIDGRWRSFYFDGASWRSPGSRAVWNDTSVPAGGTLLLHRRGEAAPATLTQDPP